MILPPININHQASLSEGLYEALKSAINLGQINSGDKLTETMIAGHANISRTPVREALQRLLNEGFLEQSGRSLTVSKVSIQALTELCVIRENLEGLAARLAAINRSDSDIFALESFNNLFKQAVGNKNLDEIITHNHAFHSFIWEASQNKYLKNQVSLLRDSIIRMQASTLHSEERQLQAIQEHQAITEAIKNSDAELAERLTQEHFRKAEAIRLTELRMKQIRNLT